MNHLFVSIISLYAALCMSSSLLRHNSDENSEYVSELVLQDHKAETHSLNEVEYPSELKLQDPAVVGEVIVTSTKHFLMKVEDLPTSWDYRTLGYLTDDLNQHIPTYCGSCWAHAAVSSIADRIKIMTKGKQRDVIPAVQVLINCGDAGNCQGGDSNAANAWIYKNTIPDTTCQQYQSKNMACNAINTCMTCDHKSCTAITSYPAISLVEYGTVSGDTAIMAEIFMRGPVSVYINAICLLDYKGGVNKYDNCDNTITNHAVQLNGWGTENGVDYWIGRNSWGTYWGENGFFRIVRGGTYNIGTAFWAVPKLPESFSEQI